MSFSEDGCTERRSRLHYSSGGLDPSGNDGLLPAISGRRRTPQPAVRCGTDGLRAGVVNPPGLTCAALPLTSEGGSASSGVSALRHRQLSAHACKSSS